MPLKEKKIKITNQKNSTHVYLAEDVENSIKQLYGYINNCHILKKNKIKEIFGEF